jgi:hypothetical protein
MTASALRLVDGAMTYNIRPVPASGNDAIICTSWDLGYPSPREVTQDIAGGNGQYDLTEFFGPRVVTMTMWVLDDTVNGYSRHKILQDLRQMASPNRRPRLYITRQGIAGEYFMGLRGSSCASTVAQSGISAIECTLTFVANSGVLESSDMYVATAYPAGSTAGVLMTSSGTLMTSLGQLMDVGASTALVVNNSGTVSSPPVLKFTGPGTSVNITNTYIDGFGNTIGRAFYFPQLALTTGQYVQIDTETGEMYLSTGDSAIPYLDVTSKSWTLSPGNNTINVSATGTQVGVSKLEVFYRARTI